jgi:hypothetical protein
MGWQAQCRNCQVYSYFTSRSRRWSALKAGSVAERRRSETELALGLKGRDRRHTFIRARALKQMAQQLVYDLE